MTLKTFTLPPDSRAVGTPDPANDMNAVVDYASGGGYAYSILNTAFAGGAALDGSTDSTAAIQACWNAAAAAGQPAFIPAGVTFVVTSLTWVAGLTVRGVYSGGFPAGSVPGQSSVLARKASSNLDMIVVPDGTNYGAIYDVGMDGNKTHNTAGYGINIKDGASGQECQIKLVRCYIHDNPFSNVYLGNNRRANHLADCTFNQSATGDGVTIAGSDNKILMCEIGSNGRAGVCIGTNQTQNWSASGSPFASDVTEVSGCDIFLNQVGVAIAQFAVQALVLGNGIDRNALEGITVYDGDTHQIMANALHSNGTLTNNTYAHIDMGSGVTAIGINNNTFGPLDSGITNVASYAVNVQAGGTVGAILGNIGVLDSTATVGGLVVAGSVGDPPKARLSNAGAIIQGVSSYDVFQLRAAGGTIFTKVGQGGTFIHSGGPAQFTAAQNVMGSSTALASSVLSLTGTATGVSQLKSQLFASQTADIWDMYASDGTTLLAKILPTGQYAGPENVLAYGADPTGSADSTTAINNADSAAVTAGNRVLVFPPGTFKVNGGLLKQSGTIWQGAGRASTVIQLAAGSNAPVLTSAGFAGLTLTGSQGGITSFAIRDMTFDGNASNQTVPAAFGVGIYGCDYLFDNVSIRNCLATDAFYTEWSASGSASSAPDKSMESMFRFLRIHDNTCTGADWHDRGPHDSAVYGCWIYNGTTSQYGYWSEAPFGTYTATGLSGTAVSSTPSTVTLNTTLSLPTAGTATMPSAGGTVTLAWTGTTATTLTGVTTSGGSGNYSSNTVTPICAYSAAASVMFGTHVWGTHSIAIVADAQVLFNGCEAEGATTGQVLIRSGTQWNAGRVFAGGSTAYGFQLGDSVNQASQAKLNWPIITGFTGGTSSKAYINVVSESQGSHEALCILSGTNQAVFGSFAVASHRKIIFVGGGSTTPAIAVAAGAGTSPPTPTVANATDLRGQAAWGTGTSPAAGGQVTVTFAQPKPGTPCLSIWPENAATAALQPYLSAFSSTAFTVGFATAPAASQSAGTYQVGYADITG